MASLKNGLFGFVQVWLVSVNTWQIANGKIIGAVVVGFCISLVWTFNVRAVVFGTMADRLLYSAGAASGCWAGIVFAGWAYA